MSQLLDETNTAAETKSYYVRSTNDNRKKEEEGGDGKPKIADFEVGKIVGAGNFAQVHKAFNQKSEEWVVLKILKKENVAAMKHVDHIINERHVLKQLTEMCEHAHQFEQYRKEICPFIVKFISSFQDNDKLYFELEYVQGCSLLTQIRQ